MDNGIKKIKNKKFFSIIIFHFYEVVFELLLFVVLNFLFNSFVLAADNTSYSFLGNKNIPPVIYLEGNTPKGLAVDIVQAMEKYMSKPIEFTAMDWKQAQQLVATGAADALVQINETEERKKIYDFSEPLLESHFSIFTNSNRASFKSISGLRGLHVGVEAGGLPEQLLQKDPEIYLIRIPDFLNGFNQINKGTLDAVVVDYRVGSYVIAENNLVNIKVIGDPILPSYSAFAVKKGNTALLNEINNSLRLIKADGTYDQIIQRWAPEEVVFQTKEQLNKTEYLSIIYAISVILFISLIWIIVLRRELGRRIKAEKLEAQAEKFAENVVNTANAMIVGLNLKGEVSFFNETAEKISGYKKEEILGKKWFETVVPVQKYPEAWKIFEDFQKNGKLITGDFQNPIISKNGEEKIIEWRNSILYEENKAVGTISFGIDITDSKKNEDINIARFHLMQYAVDHTVDEILEEALNVGEKLSGSFIGFYHFVDSDQRALTLQNWSTRTKAEFCKAKGQGEHYSVDQAGIWADCLRQKKPVIHNDYASEKFKKGMPEGHAKVIRELTVPVIRGKKVKAIMGVGNKTINYSEKDIEPVRLIAELTWEIVSRKMAEERIKELDRLKDDFLSVTTHELKTPLVPIKSQSQLLLSEDYGALNPKQKAAIEMIYRNEEILNTLSSEVLDIAKIKSNKFKLTLEEASLAKIITDVMADFSQAAKQKNILFSLNTLPQIPEITVDKYRIRQVLANLLDNAIKFTPEKGQIKIDVQRTKKKIVVSINDTGIGISSINLSRLFTPFFQVESSESRKYRGTGLGLALCKGIVEAHGGKVWAESEGEGKGSTFIFTLPIKQVTLKVPKNIINN